MYKPTITSSPSALRIEHWPLARLVPYAANARTHSDAQIARIAASIQAFGFNNPLLVDPANEVIAGHGRLLAARRLDLETVPVIVLDHLNETERRAYRLADNRLAESGGWDEEKLRLEVAALLEQNFDVPLIGFDQEELDQLTQLQTDEDSSTDEETMPETPSVPVTRRGDLWILGQHRLLCGDARQAGELDRLIAGEFADLVFTDPPYNVDYEGHTKRRLTIEGDSLSKEQFDEFLYATFTSYRRITAKHASVYVCHASLWQREFQNALEAAGFRVRCQVIWAKNTFAWGFGRYKFQHEPIFYAFVEGEKDLWYGDKSQSTLWEEKKPAANRIHPTAKPVELVERALVNSSKAGAIVADLFGGSGSTLIACERRGRKARLMEIDPAYCDVIVKRWEQYRGKKAILEGAGRTFEEVSRYRLGESTGLIESSPAREVRL